MNSKIIYYQLTNSLKPSDSRLQISQRSDDNRGHQFYFWTSI